MYLKEFWIENAWDKQSYSCKKIKVPGEIFIGINSQLKNNEI